MKVKFIHMADARGKINGAVASKNRFGNYFRTKTSPVNPQSVYQSAVRALFTAFTQGWRSLTAAQQAAFNTAVGDFKRTDVFGDLKEPTGAQLYVRLNVNIDNAGGSAITTPPTPAAVTACDSLSVDADVSDATIVNTVSPAAPATQKYLVFATPPVSPGVRFVKNKYRLIGTIDNAGGTSNDITTIYEARFGTGWKTAGKTFYVKYMPVITASGINGQPLAARAVVVA